MVASFDWNALELVHGISNEHDNTTEHDDFEVFLSGQRREETTSVDEVLKLDNSRKSKIQRLLITCSASTAQATRPEHEIQIDFDGRTVGKTKIIVTIRSDDPGWSDRALSEVEEQVERTSLQDARTAQRWLFSLSQLPSCSCCWCFLHFMSMTVPRSGKLTQCGCAQLMSIELSRF